jgi:hypothetical protein
LFCATWVAATRVATANPLAHRYFGPELGDAYVASTDEEGSLKFSMRPTRWWSVDYTKLS